jgi:hypothetical protein
MTISLKNVDKIVTTAGTEVDMDNINAGVSASDGKKYDWDEDSGSWVESLEV